MNIHDWDTLLHRLLLATVAMLLYAGPACAIGLDTFLREEFDWEGSTDFFAWLPLVIFVWLTAIPLILGIKYWEDDLQLSATWIGLFLAIALIPTVLGFVDVFRIGAALVILPALAFPFQWLDLPSPGGDGPFIISQVITYMMFAAIPLGALVIQVLQLRKSPHR